MVGCYEVARWIYSERFHKTTAVGDVQRSSEICLGPLYIHSSFLITSLMLLLRLKDCELKTVLD